MNILTHLSADDSILLNSDHQDIASHQDVISHDVINPLVTSSNPRDIINPLVTTSQQLLSHQMHRPLLDSMSQNMTSSMSCERRAAELSSYNNNNPATDDERVVQAILISHDGPQSFPQFKDNQHQQLGSPYVKITERDGKFDSWVVLPLREFQEIYQNSIDLVRRHLFGAPLSHKDSSVPGVFPCEDCGYVYNKEYNLQRHRKEKHAIIVKRVKCPYCGKFYIREDNLLRHVRNVHNQDERCVCIHCGADFYRYASLKRHILTKHKDSKVHKCNLCPKSFAFKWELKIHNQNAHVVEPGYTCELCNKNYKRPQSLAEHKKFYHEGQRVICKIDNCNELFNTMANFKRHKREMHMSGDITMKRGPAQSEERFKSYQIVPVESLGVVRCCECGLPCHGRSELQKHYKKEHKNCGVDGTVTRQKPRKTADIMYKCNQCHTTFKEMTSYESHIAKFHSSASPELSVQFPFGKGSVSCCDGACDNTGLDLSVTSQLLAIQDCAPSSSNNHNLL